MTIDERALERRWMCLRCQTLRAVSEFSEDYTDTSGHKRVCIYCEAGEQPMRASREGSTLTLECTRCHQIKPLEEFYSDNQRSASGRYFRRYTCKVCDLDYNRERNRRKALRGPYKASGTRVHVGTGLITQDKVAGQWAQKVVEELEQEAQTALQPAVPQTLPEPAVRAYADMTVTEWLAMDTSPSVFVVDHYALVLTREGDQQHIDILSIAGDGPGRPVDTALASYIVRILLHGQEDDVRGAMFY